MAGPKPPQQLRAKRTRQHLLAAARRVFADKGYAGASIDDIAQAARCSKGAYYFHFASKEDVLLALVDDWAQASLERLAQAVAAKGPEAQLRSVLNTLFAQGERQSKERPLLLEFWSQAERNPNVARRLAQARQARRDLMVRAFRRAQRSGAFDTELSPEAAAELALSFHDGQVVQNGARGAPWRGAKTALALLSRGSSLRDVG